MSRYILVAAFVASFLGACATNAGGGAGSSLDGTIAAKFEWKDKGANSGDMIATLNSGQRFAGPYFQITHQSRIDSYSSLWVGWDNATRKVTDEWQYWAPAARFITEYTGRVLANLAGPDGKHMRCSFRLRSPSAGLSQGGSGRCQLPDGRSIDAVFPTP